MSAVWSLTGVTRTLRGLTKINAIDPSLPLDDDFCCDAQCYPLVGSVLDGQFCMRRRKFIALLGSAAAAWPLSARAQQTNAPVIGVLGSTSAAGWAQQGAAFSEGLREAGYVVGSSVVLDARWADGHYERLPGLAAELVKRGVTAIAAFTTPAARAAKSATSNIPIVFVTISDPVQIGLVDSLSRPGGNVTGVTLLSVEIAPKLLELLHEVAPKATAIGLLLNPANPTAEIMSRSLQAAAQTMGLQLHIVHAINERDFEGAFEKLRSLRAEALIIPRDAFFSTRNTELAALTVRYSLPTIYQDREFAAAGGLMSYASGDAASYRQVAAYVGRILKGEKPADLPVVQTTKVELVINLKTAKAFGLTVPLPLLGRADEVIE
jgi:putative ABC transport system substrate-binding protein